MSTAPKNSFFSQHRVILRHERESYASRCHSLMWEQMAICQSGRLIVSQCVYSRFGLHYHGHGKILSLWWFHKLQPVTTLSSTVSWVLVVQLKRWGFTSASYENLGCVSFTLNQRIITPAIWWSSSGIPKQELWHPDRCLSAAAGAAAPAGDSHGSDRDSAEREQPLVSLVL